MFKLLATGAILVAVGLGLTIVGGVISGEGLTMYHGYSDYEMADPYVTDATGIGTIDVSVENRRVVVEPATDDQITITYAESTRDTIEISNVGGVITLTNDVSPWFWFMMNMDMMSTTQERTVTVFIPSALAIDLELETENGSLSVSDLPAIPSLTLDSMNGNINVSNMVGLDSLVAGTTNGTLVLDNVTVTGTTTVVTTNGNIDFNDVTCPDLHATTTNGRIDANGVTGEDVTFRSTNGDVNLEIHGELADFYVRLATTNGSLYIDDAKVTQNAFNTSLPNKLDLATTNGSVHLDFIA